MIKYAVVQIKGKQYTALPNKELVVDYLDDKKGEKKVFECDKVMLLVADNKTLIGTPYLKEKLAFDILENLKGKKIRVATYKAKANYRKVKGFRSMLTKVRLKA